MDENIRTAIERWLVKAEHDLVTAKSTIQIHPEVTDTICYHSQQCAEKSLKAYLVFVGQQIERTHYLPRLVELCETYNPDFRELYQIATDLTEYATSTRYPDDWIEIPPKKR
jgi:HEPN domain-containing protein